VFDEDEYERARIRADRLFRAPNLSGCPLKLARIRFPNHYLGPSYSHGIIARSDRALLHISFYHEDPLLIVRNARGGGERGFRHIVNMVCPCDAAPGKVLAHSGNPPCIRWFSENDDWQVQHTFTVPIVLGGAGIALYDASFMRDGFLWTGERHVSHVLPSRSLPVFTAANPPSGMPVGKTLLATDRVAFVSAGYSSSDASIRMLSCNSGEVVASFATEFKAGNLVFAAQRLLFTQYEAGVHALYRGDTRELFRFQGAYPHATSHWPHVCAPWMVATSDSSLCVFDVRRESFVAQYSVDRASHQSVAVGWAAGEPLLCMDYECGDPWNEWHGIVTFM